MAHIFKQTKRRNPKNAKEEDIKKGKKQINLLIKEFKKKKNLLQLHPRQAKCRSEQILTDFIIVLKVTFLKNNDKSLF